MDGSVLGMDFNDLCARDTARLDSTLWLRTVCLLIPIVVALEHFYLLSC